MGGIALAGLTGWRLSYQILPPEKAREECGYEFSVTAVNARWMRALARVTL
jgi:hypothetical protein